MPLAVSGQSTVAQPDPTHCSAFRQGPVSEYDFVTAETGEDYSRNLRSGVREYITIWFDNAYVPSALRGMSGGSDFGAALFSMHPKTRKPYHRPLYKYTHPKFVAPADNPAVSILIGGRGKFSEVEERLNSRVRRWPDRDESGRMVGPRSFVTRQREFGLDRVEFPNFPETDVAKGRQEAWVRTDLNDVVTFALACSTLKAVPNPGCRFYKNIGYFEVKASFNKKLLPQLSEIEDAVDDFVHCLTQE